MSVFGKIFLAFMNLLLHKSSSLSPSFHFGIFGYFLRLVSISSYFSERKVARWAPVFRLAFFDCASKILSKSIIIIFLL